MAEQSEPGAVHGHRDADPDPELRVSPVAKIMVSIALIGLLAAALMWPLVHGFARSSRAGDPVERIDVSRPAAPRLQAEPEEDLRRVRAREAVALHSYGWVDEEGGIARIPVDRAVELVLEQGLDAAPAAPAPEPAAASAEGEVP